MAYNGTFLSYSSCVLRCQHATLVLALLLTTIGSRQPGCHPFANGFHLHVNVVAPKFYPPVGSSWMDDIGVACSFATLLEAKNTHKNKKRSGGARGGGRRGKAKRDIVPDEDESNGRSRRNVQKVREPQKLRKRLIELDRPNPQNQQQHLPPLRVCSVEVDDPEWWEQEGNDNPYGARMWPSALAISEFLVGGMGGGGGHNNTNNSLEDYEILEVGCGAGLVSIVAAECGARVIASDISPTVLKLCRTGWKETQKVRHNEELAREKKREQKQKLQRFRQLSNNANAGVGAASAGTTIPSTNKSSIVKDVEEKTPMASKPGSLDTLTLDLFSDEPLPVISSNSTNPKMVIATAMLYEAGLATMLAQRAIEACRYGAWVVIGDDDTGEREGGRNLFVSELDRLENEEEASFSRIWTTSKVRSKALQWNEKQVKILHLNAPQELQEYLKSES